MIKKKKKKKSKMIRSINNQIISKIPRNQLNKRRKQSQKIMKPRKFKNLIKKKIVKINNNKNQMDWRQNFYHCHTAKPILLQKKLDSNKKPS